MDDARVMRRTSRAASAKMWTRRDASCGLLAAGALIASGARASGPKVFDVRSPDGTNVLRISASGERIEWSVKRRGRVVLEPSMLGLSLVGGIHLSHGAQPTGQQRQRLTGRWSPQYGIAAQYDANCEELTVSFEHAPTAARFDVIVRAYDRGVAIRYRLTRIPQDASFMTEETRLRFPAGARCHASRDEGEYAFSTLSEMAPVPHPDLTASSDRGPLADLPVTIVLPAQLWILIGESDRLHYPRAMLRADESQADTLRIHLMQYPGRATGYSGPGDTPPQTSFSLEQDQATPWRLLWLADSPRDLPGADELITTLASPSILGNTDWIRPGRAVRVTKPYTTDRSLDVVAFARRRKLEYVEFDAHWYGDGTDASDATRPIAGLDLQRVIQESRAAGIGVIVYVDRVPAMTQLPAIVKTYQDWGIAGIKFGFVWEGRQSDNDFIQDMLRTCGEHGLLVNLHDNLRPAGLQRTLPNYIALEGVRGNEQFPTSRHNATLPFTRAAAGPIDYTICYANERNRTTNAHQLALAAIYYNPLTFLYWYDEPQKYANGEWPELEWFDECPTVWDESVVLEAGIGECVAIARRRGRRWFLGAITNEHSRRLRLSLGFLGSGRWRAVSYGDGVRAERAFETPVVITASEVRASDVLDLNLACDGGQAIRFEPV